LLDDTIIDWWDGLKRLENGIGPFLPIKGLTRVESGRWPVKFLPIRSLSSASFRRSARHCLSSSPLPDLLLLLGYLDIFL
jgi:hypothetical protein